MVRTGTESITYPGSWLGAPGTDAIKISKIDAVSNMAFGAETRINHSNSSGYGKIADFKFQAKTVLSAADIMHFSISAYQANDSAGTSVIFNTHPDSIIINPLGTGISESNNHNEISIYPNPYSGSTQITYSLNKKSDINLEIYNTIGQRIETLVNTNQSAGKYNYQFSAKEKGFVAGIYFIKITVDGKSTMKKIVELK